MDVFKKAEVIFVFLKSKSLRKENEDEKIFCGYHTCK